MIWSWSYGSAARADARQQRWHAARSAFLVAIVASGGLVLLWSIVQLASRPLSPQWLVLVVLTVVAGWAALRLRGVPASFSISDTFTIAAALLFGPAAATVTVAVDALVMSLRLRGGRQPPVRVLFNATGPALAMWIAAQVFFRTADLGPQAYQPGTIRGVIGPLALFALLYFVLNTGLVATAVALDRQASVVAIWREHFAPLWLTYFGGASIAAVLVLMTIAQVIDLSALMLVLPLVVVLHLAYRAALDRANERVEHLTQIASYAAALRSTADGVLITDGGGRVTLLNAAAEALTAWSERAASGRPLAEVFQTRDPASGADRDVLTAGEGLLREYQLTSRDGVARAIEEMHASIRNDDGEIAGAIITFRDITERLASDRKRNALLAREQQARAEADAASRMKDEFLTTLSHELRTPATSILGWVHMFRKSRLEGPPADHALDALERSARAQAALIEDLIDVSHIVSGTMPLALQPVAPAALLEAEVAAAAADAAARDVTLQARIDRGIPAVQGDPTRLAQVFRSMLSNAVKFTDAGGVVVARMAIDGEYVDVEVSDSGRGIDPALLPFVFDRFRQGDSSATRSHGGLGLGLAIVRHIVERHGGTVTAESGGVGRGARFIVRLPLPRRAGAAQASVAPDDGVEPHE